MSLSIFTGPVHLGTGDFLFNALHSLFKLEGKQDGSERNGQEIGHRFGHIDCPGGVLRQQMGHDINER